MTDSVNQVLNSSDHWAKLFNAQRLGSHKKAPAEDSARSSFHKDYDRLVFSHSFRQLNQKTQVHPLTNQLGIHTRLTHSLEVSCIGRSLGIMAAEKLHDKLGGGLPNGVFTGMTKRRVANIMRKASCLDNDADISGRDTIW